MRVSSGKFAVDLKCCEGHETGRGPDVRHDAPRNGRARTSWRRQDTSVVGQKLAKGTLRRIVRFAKPYRWHITLFLLLVIISAFLVIASPLLFKKIVDDGISKGNAPLVTALALVVAVLAVVEAGARSDAALVLGADR